MTNEEKEINDILAKVETEVRDASKAVKDITDRLQLDIKKDGGISEDSHRDYASYVKKHLKKCAELLDDIPELLSPQEWEQQNR